MPATFKLIAGMARSYTTAMEHTYLRLINRTN